MTEDKTWTSHQKLGESEDDRGELVVAHSSHTMETIITNILFGESVRLHPHDVWRLERWLEGEKEELPDGIEMVENQDYEESVGYKLKVWDKEVRFRRYDSIVEVVEQALDEYDSQLIVERHSMEKREERGELPHHTYGQTEGE